jgi:2-oxoglutarate dehydrogenase E2 component (dihydrolipoamide succinyltransferase)
MPVEIRVPQMGESIVEATVGRWLKREGETVSPGQALVELETEKVNMEVPAEQGGVLQQVLKKEGETVHLSDVLGVIAEEASAPAPTPAANQDRGGRPAEQSAQQPSDGRRGEAAASDGGETDVSGVTATPVARNLAAEHGLSLADVHGTGPGGKITKEDVLALVEHPQERGPEPPPPPTEEPAVEEREPSPRAERAAAPQFPAPQRREDYEERVRLSRRRLTMARRLVEAQRDTAPATTFNEIDMAAVMDLRRRRREAFRERHGVDLGLMPFFVKAVIGALRAFPVFNSELQGEDLVLKYYYHIGIAVASEEGLVVPVLRDAEKLTFAEIESSIQDMVRRTRERKLTIDELQGGTFTITNGGIFGSLLSTPILNPPQVGILGMHRIEERPVAVDGQVVVHPMMYTALTYDHRVVDGEQAVRYLGAVKQFVEDPVTLLLER